MENRFQKIIDKIKERPEYYVSDEFKKYGFEKNNTFEYKLYDVFDEWIAGCILHYSYPPGHKSSGTVETVVGCVWNLHTGDCIVGSEEEANRYVIAIADLNAYDPNTIRFNSFEIPVEFREFLILTNANPDSIPGSELHIISLDVGAVLQYTSDLPFEMYFDTTFVVTDDTAV